MLFAGERTKTMEWRPVFLSTSWR